METILIIGASQGLGLEWVRHYKKRGSQVIATARNPDTSDELKALLDDNDIILQLDVIDNRSVVTAMGSLIEAPDIVIYNAGVKGYTKSPDGAEKLQKTGITGKEEVSREAERELAFHVNAYGFDRTVHALRNKLLEKPGAAVIYVSSGVADTAQNISGGYPHYRQSKTAGEAYARAWDIDLLKASPPGRRPLIFSIIPGIVNAGMGKGIEDAAPPEDRIKEMVAVIDHVKETGDTHGVWKYDGTKYIEYAVPEAIRCFTVESAPEEKESLRGECHTQEADGGGPAIRPKGNMVVIMDWDNTIMASADFLNGVHRETARRLKEQGIGLLQEIPKIATKTKEGILSDLFGHENLETVLGVFHRVYADIFRPEDLSMLNGARQFLEKIYLCGIPFAIVSNYTKAGIQEHLMLRNIPHDHIAIFGVDSPEKTKPAPEAGLRALSNLQIKHSARILMIGDGISSDMVFAKNLHAAVQEIHPESSCEGILFNSLLNGDSVYSQDEIGKFLQEKAILLNNNADDAVVYGYCRLFARLRREVLPYRIVEEDLVPGRSLREMK